MNKRFRIGYVSVFSVQGNSREEALEKFEEWVKNCSCGTLLTGKNVKEFQVFGFNKNGKWNPDNDIICINSSIYDCDCDCIVDLSSGNCMKKYNEADFYRGEEGTEYMLNPLSNGSCEILVKMPDHFSIRFSDNQSLAACYWDLLQMAREKLFHSIAFPAWSMELESLEKEEAANVAMDTVLDWLSAYPEYGMKIYMCCAFGDVETKKLYQQFWEEGDDIL